MLLETAGTRLIRPLPTMAVVETGTAGVLEEGAFNLTRTTSIVFAYGACQGVCCPKHSLTSTTTVLLELCSAGEAVRAAVPRAKPADFSKARTRMLTSRTTLTAKAGNAAAWSAEPRRGWLRPPHPTGAASGRRCGRSRRQARRGLPVAARRRAEETRRRGR